MSDKIYDGNRAKEILENEVFQQVFQDIEQELMESWKTSPQRDVDAREKIHLAITLLGKVKTCLQTTFETGKLAEMEHIHKRTMAEKAKEFLTPIW
jgi:hypothetical protein